MINKELNKILHECLDDKIHEKYLVELIESFTIETHYYFTFRDHEIGEKHSGIISKSFQKKMSRRIKKSKKQYPKKIWKNIKFYKHNHIKIPRKQYYTEKSIRKRCVKKNKGFFLYKRNQNIMDRVYYISFISRSIPK